MPSVFPPRVALTDPCSLFTLLLTVALACLAAWPAFAWSESIGPTVKEVVEFTRILQPANHDNDALQSQISPDGKRAFVVTRKADVATDRNRVEVLLLDIRPERLADRSFKGPTLVYALDSFKDNYDGDPSLRDARWVNDRTIAFRARVHDAPFQVYLLEVTSGRVKQLTHEPYGLLNFDLSKDLRRVVYKALVPNPPIPQGARSIVVQTHSFFSLQRPADLHSQQRRYRFMVTDAGSRRPATQLGEVFVDSPGNNTSPAVSPDGRWVLLPRFESDRQIEWGQRYPRIAENTRKFGPAVSLDPLSYYSRPFAYVPRRVSAFRLTDGHEQVALDAPDDSDNKGRTDHLWQDGGRSVVIAGTYLPPDADASVADTASHIVEYWPDTRRWKDIARLHQGLTDTLPVAGRKDSFIAIDGDEQRHFERRANGDWQEGAVGNADAALTPTRGAPRGTWRLTVDESLNSPPDIVATSPIGETVRLTHFNPQHSSARWGNMQAYAWTDGEGRQWNGGLMVPANFDPRAKYPLVIQTYGFSPTRFYRDGMNVAEGATSGFAGRAFLRENMLVLAMHWAAATGSPREPHAQNLAFADGVRGAIDALVAAGTVDRERVGILGWSATGEQVLDLVTFTDVPIKAATLLDGDSNTLFSMTITYSLLDGIQIRKERTNEGSPFGESLVRWTRNDPSLHTDCIRAALRIEGYGPEVKNNWDIYALLRRQYKPAEMIIFPQGAHSLARPSDRMISLQGNVDWYRYWLKGEQRTTVLWPGESKQTLAAQYVRWNQMAELKRLADAKPRCVRHGDAE